MGRAIRRHHTNRLKSKRAPWHWGRDLRGNAKAIGKAVATPCVCSGHCCGNQRKVSGETKQERFARMQICEHGHER